MDGVHFRERLLRLLPLPPRVRRRWRADFEERSYREALDDARKHGDTDEVERLKFSRMADHQLDFEDREIAYSKQLLSEARQLRVPVPPPPYSYGESEHWHMSAQGERYLSERGIGTVRKLIRSERRWLQEQRSHWIAWLTVLTGVIGALTGLLAVALR